jgi:hypothetical protein
MQKQIQAIRKQHQAGSSNFVTRDFLTPLDQEQAIQTQQQEAGSSRQGDPSSLSGHLKSIDDDFAIWWSLKSRELHDQTQATSSQNTPEIRQPFAAYHPAEVQHESISQRANVRQQDQIGQRQDAMVQQHEVQDKVDLSKKTSKKILRDFFDELQNNRLKITDTRVSTMLNKNNVYTKKDLRLYSESALELYKEALDKKSRNIYDSIARLINRRLSY